MCNYCSHFDSFPWQRSVDVKNKCNFSLSLSYRTKPCLPAFPGSGLWIVACHLTTLPKMKYAWFRCTDVSVHKQVLLLNYQHVGTCSFLYWEYQKSTFLFLTQQMYSPQRWQSLLSSVKTHESIQEAIFTRSCILASMFAFGITSSDALERLIQDILLNTEALGSTLGGHRSKCEHLAARSKHPLCVARVVGALPRDELKSVVDNRLA